MAENKIGQSKVHLIGVGGIGMSGIAEVLIGLGAKVSGSDIKKSDRTDYLEKIGVNIFLEHKEEHIKDVDVVVFSSAISKTNPEFIKAGEMGIPLISRAEALAELMRSKRGIAIAGTHGKTTTTSMIAQVFEHSSKNPTVVSGGIVLKFGTNAKLGTGEWFIAEADESDGSFEKLSPEISVITNVDNDHLEHYGHFENVLASFRRFAEKVPFYGSVVYCGDDRDCEDLLKGFPKRTISYGFGEENEFSLREINRGAYEVYHNQNMIGALTPPLPGSHNALNALAAIVVSLCAGIDFETARQGVEDFSGVKRRFEIKADFEEKDIVVVDDYAHHPTEITATLSACRSRFLGSKVKCVFQPHRYSRLQGCWDQFKNAFDFADEIYLLDVYPAGEQPIKGYESSDLYKEILNKDVKYINANFDGVVEKLVSEIKSGDVLITLGAGDVYKVSDQFVAKLKENE